MSKERRWLPWRRGNEPGSTDMAEPTGDENVDRMEFLLSLRRRGISDQAVLRAIDAVPREKFVLAEFADSAYADQAMPISCGQTISQPYVVAYMTEQLGVTREHRVLEVGTGSGYQAAVLAGLVRLVHTIEIIPGLADTAARTLRELGYANVVTHVGDGYYGVEEAAPFDGVIVTAAAGHVPPPLVRQLRPGGRMVIPVGSLFAPQYLMLVEKDATGGVRTRQTLPVAFVPLTVGG
jgi:protein-L-isoaspartate(D-aspartate) O-methyltransferase